MEELENTLAGTVADKDQRIADLEAELRRMKYKEASGGQQLDNQSAQELLAIVDANPRIADLERQLKQAGEALVVHPVSEYHEDHGTVLWWHDPVEEPPYVGTLNDLEPGTVPRLVREGWLTHWSKIPTVWDGDGKLRAAIEGNK